MIKQIELITKNKLLIFTCFIIFFSIIVNIFSKFDISHTEYQYDNEKNGDNVAIPLLELTPKSMNIEISTNANLDTSKVVLQTSRNLLESRALVVSLSNKLLSISVYSTKFKQDIQVNDKNQKILIHYFNSKKIIQAEVNEKKYIFNLKNDEAPFISGIHVRNKSENLSIKSQIETLDNKRKISNLKNLTSIISIIFIFIYALRVDKIKFFMIANFLKRLFKIKIIDLYFMVGLIFTAIIFPPGIDDGEILNIQKNYDSFGFASSYSNPYPLGQFWFWLNSLWSKNLDNVTLLRVPNILIIYLSWKIINIFIISKINQRDNKNQYIYLLSAILFTLSWGGTLRYDTYIILCSAILLCIIFNYSLKYVTFYFTSFSFIFVQALTSSVSGISVAFLVIPFVYQYFKSQKIRISKIILYCAILFNFGAIFLFYKSNIYYFLNDLNSFSNISKFHSILNVSEYRRYYDIFQFWNAGARSTVILLFASLVSILLILPNLRKNISNKQKVIIYSVFLNIFGLIFTSSKVGWHFAVYFPAFLILTIFIINLIEEFKIKYIYLTILLVGMIFAIKGRNVNRNTESITYQVNGPVDYLNFKTNFESATFIMILIIIISFYFVLKLFKTKHVTKIVLSFYSVSFICISIFFPIFDSFNSLNWNFTKQTTLGLIDQDNKCGISGVTDVINPFKLREVKDSKINENFISIPEIKFMNFLSQKNFEMVYNVKENQPIIFWISGITTPQDGQVILTTRDSKNNSKTQSLELNYILNKNNYESILVNDEKNIVEIKINIINFVGDLSKLKMTKLYYFENKNMQKLLMEGNNLIHTYRGNILFFPCQDWNNKEKGLFKVADFQYGSSTNMEREKIINSEVNLFPLGCLEMSNILAQKNNCIYFMEKKGQKNLEFKDLVRQSKGLF